MEKIINQYLKKFEVVKPKHFSLKKYNTDFDHKIVTKKEGDILLQEGIAKLAKLQDILYANQQTSVLIVFQAMDAAGKDGAIKHVMAGLNPQGVKVTSFKSPSTLELAHDYLWRHSLALPGRGEIAIFNRSYYENVLITKVHPEFILKQNIPHIDSLKKIDKSFWQSRYNQINDYEKHLTDNGTLILKFFLHVSKDEQKIRFMERINNPAKNWKFSAADLKERSHWIDYQLAYQDAIASTATKYAPWFVIPADDKWFMHLSIGAIIYNHFKQLKLSYPKVSQEQLAELQVAKAELLAED